MKHIRSLILALALFAGLAPAFAQAPPAVPALPDTERRTTYSISSSTCACAVGFQLYGDSTDVANWIEVWVNGTLMTQSGNWTISSPTGSLATIPRPITDAVLTFTQAQTGTVQIVGARRPRRTAQFAENRGVAARDLNQVLTDIVAQNRETWDKINDVTGRAVLAPPGETLAILASAASRKNLGACFDNSGNLVACVSIPTSTLTAGNGITLTGTNPTTITNNIQGAGPITITGTNPLIIGCPTCASSVGNVSSRATAITQDLHTFSVVRTGGYAAGGDGGGATFVNVGSAPFIDSFISGNCTLATAGSAYTNGTYYGVKLTGGTGSGAQANITVTGGVVTSVTVTGTGGNAYTAGNTLSALASSLGGTGSGFTCTVGAVTAPTGSFTDSAGTHFQIVVDAGNFPNVRQFGAKLDRAGKASDGLATNDKAAFQNAIGFAAYGLGFTDAGGNAGNKVMVPAGTSLICGGLMVPVAVRLVGAGQSSTTLKECDTEASTQNFITLGDPLNRQTAFFSGLDDMTLFGANSGITGTVAMVYSNNAQGTLLNQVAIYPVYRGVVYTEIGYGGPNMQNLHSIYAVPAGGVTLFGISMTGAAIIKIDGYSWFSAGSFWNGQAIALNSSGPGLYEIDDFYCENMSVCVFHNIPAGGNNPMTHINGISGSASATNVISRAAGSTSGQLVVELATGLGATCTVLNAGSCVAAGQVIARTTY